MRSLTEKPAPLPQGLGEAWRVWMQDSPPLECMLQEGVRRARLMPTVVPHCFILPLSPRVYVETFKGLLASCWQNILRRKHRWDPPVAREYHTLLNPYILSVVGRSWCWPWTPPARDLCLWFTNAFVMNPEDRCGSRPPMHKQKHQA